MIDILLVIGADLVGASRLPLLLHRAGCRVTLLAPIGILTHRSRYIHHHVRAADRPAELAEDLRLHLAHHAYAWVLIADEDVLLEVASRHDEAWTAACLPVANNADSVDLITSKHAFLTEARRLGLPVPAFQVCHSRTEAQAMAEQVGYPLVLKLAQGRSGLGVQVIASAAALDRIPSEFFTAQPVAVQQFAAGQLGSTEVLFDRGRPVAWIHSYHRECWPTPLSASCVRELTDLPAMTAALETIGEMTGFHGFGGVDWIWDGAQLNILEFNPRATPCYHIGPIAGVDFAAAVRDLLAGRALMTRRPRLRRQRVVHLFPEYVHRAAADRAPHRALLALRHVAWAEPRMEATHLRRLVGCYLVPGPLKGAVKGAIKQLMATPQPAWPALKRWLAPTN
jgi:biotin carboxylase